MLRIIHQQTVAGAILVDDIDDGLPNKLTHRMGSTADPKSYIRDGYANAPKQSCYVPRTHAANPALPGYIDLDQTPRVVFSAGKGKISNLSRAGLVDVVSFSASDVLAPTLASAATNTPTSGKIRLTGTHLTSVLPQVSNVIFTTTKAYLKVAGGSSPNGDVVYEAKVSGSSGTTIRIHHVVSGTNTSLDVSVLGPAITVTVATDGGGAPTSTATQVAAAVAANGLASGLVTAYAQGTGGGVVAAVAETALNLPSATLTATTIAGTSGGSVSATSIVIPASLVPAGAVKVTGATGTTVKVTANEQTTGSVALS